MTLTEPAAVPATGPTAVPATGPTAARPKYVGDPVNAVRIFNEKEVDELMLLVGELVLTRNQIVQNVARARPITAGVTRQDEVTILNGLSGGELLVNHPPDTLKDGDRVRPKP